MTSQTPIKRQKAPDVVAEMRAYARAYNAKHPPAPGVPAIVRIEDWQHPDPYETHCFGQGPTT